MNPKLSVGRSLQILAAMVLAGLAASLWVFMDYAGSATKAMDRIINVEGESAFLLNEMWAQGLQTEQALRNLILNPGDEKATSNYQEADQGFAKANEMALSLNLPSRAELVNTLDKWRDLRTLKGEVRQLAVNGQRDKAVALLNANETPKWREIRATVLRLIEEHRKQFKAAFAEQKQKENREKTIILGVTILLSLVILASLYLVARRIEFPLEAMGDFSRKIAGGDFSARLDSSYALEFERLKKSLVTMTQELKDSLGFSRSVMHGFRQPFLTVDHEARITFINQPALDMLDIPGKPEQFMGQPAGAFFYDDPSRPTNIAKLIKSGDWSSSNDITLTGRKGRVVQLRADRCQLRDLEGQTIGGISTYMDLTAIKESERLALARAEDIRHAAHETGNIASGLFESTERLSSQINQVARGSAEQRERTQQASQSMEDLNASVALVAKSAEQALSEAARTEEKALAGAQVVKSSMQAIHMAAENAKDLGANMERLGQQSQSIGQVLEVISDIADQTNLLALNAAIEAARAGEAGRGFAVVADEVRKLAEKTMAATKEVGDKIQAIQDSAKSSLEGMRQATETIGQATRLAGESETALREIVALAQTNALSGQNIVEAAREQSRVAREIAKSSEDVRRIADQTDEGMNTASQALEQLIQMAGALKDLVDRLSA